jgi:hypothetical protein
MVALLAGMGTALAQGPSTPASGSPPAGAVKLPAAGPDTAPALMPGADGTIPAPAEGTTSTEAPPDTYGVQRWYGSAEYILWRLKDTPLPESFVTLPVTTTGINQFNSSVNISNGSINYGGRSGARFTLGYWIDPATCGIENTGFWVEKRNNEVLNTQQVNQTLNLTIIQNVVITSSTPGGLVFTPQQIPVTVSLPAVINVTASGSVIPSSFWGDEMNVRSTKCYFGGLSVDFLAGFRYINLSEGVQLGQTTTLQIAQPNGLFTAGLLTPNGTGGFTNLPTIPPPIAGVTTILAVNTVNQMMTHNNFFGANFGTSWDWAITDRIHFEGYGKIGVGAMVESFTYTGGSAVTTAAVAGFVPGATIPNLSFFNYGKTQYAVTPELNLKLGYQLSRCLRATIGYNFLYLSSVMRPGEQISFNPFNVNNTASATTTTTTTTPTGSATNLNVAGSNISVPSSQQPIFAPTSSDFWAQGLTIGLEVKY